MPGENKKVILVTGATGLIGKAIKIIVENEKQQKDEKWIFVSSKDANLIDLSETKRLFEKYKPTHVIHLAAKIGGLFHYQNNNLIFLRSNLQINDNVLLTSHETGVVKVVSMLSNCIFPDKVTYPVDETVIHLGPPDKSMFGYTYSKRLLDVLNHIYYTQHGKMFTSVLPCNVFGPYDNFGLGSGHVIPSLIHKLYNIIQEGGKTFTVLGSGKPLRQFIYSNDVARLILWSLRNYDSVEPLILSVDEKDEVSIAEAATLIASAFKFDGEIVYDSSFSDGQLKRTASNAKLRSLLKNDFRFTPLKQAILETVDWFKENQAIARI